VKGPRKQINGVRKKVSRWVMESHIGRELDSDEIVHHIDEDPTNNNIENLVLMTISEHRRHHMTGDRNPFFGEKHTEEFKKWLSESRKGAKNHRYGKKHSEETKQKMREARLKRTIYKDSKGRFCREEDAI